MLLRHESLALLLLACLAAASCGACPPAPARPVEIPAPALPAYAAPYEAGTPDLTIYWANLALVTERYCRPIASLSARVLDACGCSAEQRELQLLTEQALADSCHYHLIGSVPQDRVMTLNEPALVACMDALDALLVGCTEARLPASCELPRLFDPPPGDLTYSRPEGSDCRAENGDESFDAHFLCAEGLTCARTCTHEPSPDAAYREAACRNPLWLPPAIP
jgi:hypothetical protein